jgi:hypothetical protein
MRHVTRISINTKATRIGTFACVWDSSAARVQQQFKAKRTVVFDPFSRKATSSISVPLAHLLICLSFI